MYVCLCYSVTDVQAREAIRAGARTVTDLGRTTGAGTDCGQCLGRLSALIAELSASAPPATGGRERGADAGKP